ncbi:unnamed protein product [Schistosoma turkestanicum]|nr:unnamed protein product [Schistosoma turkestanicum]
MFSKKQSSESRRLLERKLYLARERPDDIFDLSSCELKMIPDGTFSLVKVLLKTKLYFQQNSLQKLDSGGKLTNLQNIVLLDISSNEFQYLPNDICELKCLQVLNVSKNLLSKLPSTITSLTQLLFLNVEDNRLTELPSDFGKLHQITKLFLKNNPLSCLPKQLCYLKDLKELTLSYDQIQYPTSVKASVSQCNVTKIPTICLDNNLELTDGCDSGLGGRSEEEFYGSEEQAFGINELFYFSRLSCINSHKKFLIAIVLLSQCDEGYRCAAQQWLNNTILDSKEDLDQVFLDINESDYLKKLRSTSASTNELLDILKKLTPLSAVQYNNESYHHISHNSVSAKPETDNIYCSGTRPRNMFGDSPPADIDGISQNFQSIKRQYLELVSNSFISSLVTDCDPLIKKFHNNPIPLREVAVQTSIGQLFIATILHASFNEDDRKWLLSSIRNKYKGLSKESNTLLKHGSSDDGLCSKLFDCLVDLGLDLSCALQRITDSSSHSLTSSGFLSGCGGSDSQYDLFMEASNSGPHSVNHNNSITTTKANYGALLTVPNAEVKLGFSNNFYNNHLYCSHSQSTSSHFSHRRLSDIPRVSNYHSLPSSQCHSQNLPNNNDQENKAPEIFDVSTNQNSLNTSKDFNDLPTVSSPSPPTSVQSSTVDTNSGETNLSSNVIYQQRVSTCTLSDSSSISSSNTELGVYIPHSPTSIFLASTSPEPVKSYENIVTQTSSSHHFPTVTDGQTICDHRESLSTAEHSNLVNNHHPPSQTHDHVPMNFPKIQNESNHSIMPRNLNKFTNPTDVEHNSHCVIDENNFLNPSSGMTAVPFWLKSLRLHKYASLFQNLSYDEMMNITDDWLKQQNVTQGARNKILLSIEKLKHRKSTLYLMEKRLTDLSSTDQLTQTILNSCLSEIKHILLTPIKPCREAITLYALHLNQLNSRSCSSSPIGGGSSFSTVYIHRKADVSSINTTTTTPTTTTTTITNSTFPLTVSSSLVNMNTTVHNTRNTLTGNNDNDNCSGSSTNFMNNTTNNPKIVDYYCTTCDINSLCGRCKCYGHTTQQQHQHQQQLTAANNTNEVFIGNNNNNNQYWSPSMTNLLSNMSSYGGIDNYCQNDDKLHNLTLLLSSNVLNRSNQNEWDCMSNDEYDDQKRIDHVDADDDDDDHNSIPGYIIACLTKVCSSLLVTAYSGVNLYEEFLQILEIILNHVAFTKQQKKLVSFWKHRILIVYGHYITHSPNLSKSKPDFHTNIYHRHMPHMHHSDISRLNKFPTTLISPEQRLNSHMAYRANANTLPPSAVCLHNTQDTSTNMSLNIPTAIEALRRHSVSVGDSGNCLAVGRLNNRRRMPSPNLSYFSGRNGPSTNLVSGNSCFSRHPQASSDMELSGFPSQLPRPRFHSPSRFDPSTNLTPRRNLMPVATAPVTRMPSPSDVCRHGICYNDWFSPDNKGAFPTAPFPSSVSPISICEGSYPEKIISDTQLIQQLPRTPNVPASILPCQNAFHKTHSTCLCASTHNTINTTIPNNTSLTLNSSNHLINNRQHIDANYCDNSGNFFPSLNCTPIPCMPNPIVYHTFDSLYNQSYEKNSAQTVSDPNCPVITTTPTTIQKSSQHIDLKVPSMSSSCWSTDPYMHQIHRRQMELHELSQCSMHNNNIYNLNHKQINNNDNNNDSDLLVFVDNYIATAENNMIEDLSSDSSNDRINRDLDLLTRKVTEHAIGGFDSMTD